MSLNEKLILTAILTMILSGMLSNLFDEISDDINENEISYKICRVLFYIFAGIFISYAMGHHFRHS